MAARTPSRLVGLAALLLAVAVLLAASLVAVAVPLPAQASSARGGSGASLVAVQTGLLARLNQVRRSNGLAALTVNASLSAAANQHSSEMLAKGYFGHESADGSPFWKRVQRFYGSMHFSYWAVGENLLQSPGNLDAQKAMQLWMASSEHRANILTPRWREIGIGAMFRSSAAGTFDGRAVTLITTDFGVRR